MLSPRESQVAARLARGQSHGEIAADLGISIATVRTYVRRALKRNDCKTSAHLAAKYVATTFSEATK